jgi:lipid-A-disaccharide synthase
MPPRVMISCGEPSGDLYAGALAEALRAREPGVEVFGFGGARLRAAGASLVGDFGGMSATGYVGALRVVPRALAMLRRLTRAAAARRPDVFVAVDFSDFNFPLMARLRRLGVPVVYYVSPQLWAHRPGRMQAMQRHVSRALVIFPFEEDVYRRAGVPVEFVGHPLVELSAVSADRSTLLSSLGLSHTAPTVALLPGSRRNELRRIAPGMAAAVPLIRARVPGVQFVIARAPSLDDGFFAPFFAVNRPAIVEGRTDDVLAAADVAITASGTATVQAAIHECPMVVVYRLSPLEYRLGKRFVKVDMYAMPNLLAGERIVPELIQDDFTPQRVADETAALLTERERHARMRAALRQVREQLGGPGASGRAADAVLEISRRSTSS